MSRKPLILLLITLLHGLGCICHAQMAPIPTLFDTGVASNDANGNPQTMVGDNGPDPHYNIISAPPPNSAGSAVVTFSTGYPAGGIWATDDSTSKWISPHGNESIIEPPGTYIYQTTFDLTNFNPSTASISGNLWVDNQVSDVILNSTNTGITTGTYATPTTFKLTSGFTTGINTLEFYVLNGPTGGAQNPSGLRVEMTGTATNILKGSLTTPTFQTTNGRMYIDSTFSPQGGVTLAEAAAACGVDHFNFLSEIIAVPSAWTVTDNGTIVKPGGGYIQPNSPLIDPLPGGGTRTYYDPRSGIRSSPEYDSYFTDNNPSYYDDNAITTGTLPSAYLTSSSLMFEDGPSVANGMFANTTGANGETREFYTQLVGVGANGNIIDYYGNTMGLGFTWYSNQTTNGGAVYDSTLSDEAGVLPVVSGSIYGVQMVPEPASFSLLVIGSFGLLTRRYRK